MANFFKPAKADELQDVISWAAAEETTLDLVGHGTKQCLGRPTQCEFVLDLSDLSGIVSYQPEELILQASASTPIAEIERIVAEEQDRRQAYSVNLYLQAGRLPVER